MQVPRPELSPENSPQLRTAVARRRRPRPRPLVLEESASGTRTGKVRFTPWLLLGGAILVVMAALRYVFVRPVEANAPANPLVLDAEDARKGGLTAVLLERPEDGTRVEYRRTERAWVLLSDRPELNGLFAREAPLRDLAARVYSFEAEAAGELEVDPTSGVHLAFYTDDPTSTERQPYADFFAIAGAEATVARGVVDERAWRVPGLLGPELETYSADANPLLPPFVDRALVPIAWRMANGEIKRILVEPRDEQPYELAQRRRKLDGSELEPGGKGAYEWTVWRDGQERVAAPGTGQAFAEFLIRVRFQRTAAPTEAEHREIGLAQGRLHILPEHGSALSIDFGRSDWRGVAARSSMLDPLLIVDERTVALLLPSAEAFFASEDPWSGELE